MEEDRQRRGVEGETGMGWGVDMEDVEENIEGDMEYLEGHASEDMKGDMQEDMKEVTEGHG